MARLDEVKQHAARLFALGDTGNALRFYDAAVAAAPLDFTARCRVADCLAALEQRAAAGAIYRAISWYALKSGHPLFAVVCARLLESLGQESADVLAALVVRYGSESELIGRVAARINLPEDATPVTPPDLRAAAPPDLIATAAHRAAHCCDAFNEYPESVHPIPLLSTLSEGAFRRVLGTIVVKRLPDRTPVIREGEAGHAFYFVAGGQVRVFATDALGRQSELARLHEGAVFGEMALLSAQPRNASVEVIGEADLLEVTRSSLATLADELAPVAAALHQFTQERLLKNLLASAPLFRPFSRVQQLDLLRRFTSHDVAPGTTIIGEGEEGRGLFVILTGEVEVSARDVPLATLRAGDVFGEMALLRGGPTTATVTASRHSTVLYLAREYVARIVAGVPQIKSYLDSLAEERELETQLLLDDEQTDEGEPIVLV